MIAIVFTPVASIASENPQAQHENGNEDANKIVIFEAQVKNLSQGHALLEALVDDQIFLPLKDVIRLFGFPIEFQADNTIKGSYISPGNEFLLDLNAHQVRAGNINRPLTERDIRQIRGRLYVSCASFSEWFGISLTVDRAQHALRFDSDKTLPQEEHEERQKKWAELNQEKDASAQTKSLGPVSSESTPKDIVDIRTFSGSALPQSDIELYHGAVLVAVTTADRNGRYVFADVPVYVGKNVYRTLVFAPNGGFEYHDEVVVGQMTALLPKAIQSVFTKEPSSLPPPPEQKQQPNLPPVLPPVIEVQPPGNKIAVDLIPLKVVTNRLTLGMIDAYLDRQNTYLRLRKIVEMLGYSYSRRDGSAELIPSEGPHIFLDFQKGEYVVNSEHISFHSNDLYELGGETFANIALLNRMLPQLGFVIDLALHQIDVAYLGTGLPSAEPITLTAKSNEAPPPQAAPVQPVIVDDLTHPKEAMDIPVPESKDVLHVTEESDKNPLPPPPPSIPIANVPGKGPGLPEEKAESEEPLILLPRIKNMAPNDEFIEGLDTPNGVFLPLNDIIHIFDFPIRVDDANKSASGFFISPGNIFSLDMNKKEVRAKDKQFDLTPKDTLFRNEKIYVSCESFENWFGIKAEVDRPSSSIHFTTDQILPQEEKEVRQKRWNSLLREVNDSKTDLELIQNPYQDFAYPAVDINLGALYNHQPSSDNGSKQKAFMSNYNVQGSGDIARLTGNVYAQGSTYNNALEILRVQAGRKDPSSDLLGPLHATEFEFGDITSPSLSLVTANTLGRGVFITNRDINASENFDFRNFSGNSVPGYEAELYRNDVLIAFQTVDPNGRYNFPNIPILYGENIFRVVLYGQQGQREEKTETVSASGALLKENQFSYTFGLQQRGDSLIPVGSSKQSIGLMAPPGNQAVADLHYGITRDVTVGMGLAEAQLIDGEHRYASASTDENIFGILTEGNFVQDLTSHGWAASAAALGGFEGVSLHARYRKFENFMSEAVNNTSMQLTSDQSLDANTQMYIPFIGNYSLGVSALRETFVDPTLVPRYTYSWRSSTTLGGVSFTDAIDYVLDEQKRFQDTFGVQTRVFNTDLRATGVFGIKPDNRLREASFMADYKLFDKLSAQSQYDKNMLSGVSTYTQNIIQDFDEFRLSLSGQYASNKSYGIGLNFIFSAKHDSLSDTWHTLPKQTSESGSVSARVYIEDDQDKKEYPGAKVKINNILVVPNADDFFSATVAPYQKNLVSLDTNSIGDPLLSPKFTDVNVVTRPGDNVVVEIPLVHTTIVDGTIYFIDDTQNKHEMGNLVVELEDKDGKPLRRVMSSVDGYFSFDKVEAGEYALSVPDEVLNSLNATIEKKISVIIDKIDEFMTGNDITLRQKEKLDAPPPMPLPVPPKENNN